MGKILNAYIFPHAPILISKIGKNRTSQAVNTVRACEKAALEIYKDMPDTIIISTPHAPGFSDYVVISDTKILNGNFDSFGEHEISLSFENNLKLAEKISQMADFEGIGAGFLTKSQKNLYGISDFLDHGSAVPLYFINEEFKKHDRKFSVVCISTPFLSLFELYEFGKIIGKAVGFSENKAVYVASGDLSHRLTVFAPAGYSPEGEKYDKRLVSLIGKSDFDALLNTDPVSMEKAGECGTRSFAIMYGAMSCNADIGKNTDSNLKSEIFSYEGPFGVGYMVAKISAKEVTPEKNISKEAKYGHAALARDAILTFIKSKEIISVPENIPEEFKNKQCGCFVSIKKNGELRGCMGTIFPAKTNLAEEIIYNALSAAFHDYRFTPLKEDELDTIKISVDVLSPLSPVTSVDELDEKIYGVIVSKGSKKGLLLPNLEGIESPRQQILIALHKAGISPDEDYQLEKFTVERFY